MLVCICQGISDRDIVNAMQDGAVGYQELRRTLGLGSCCGQCASYAKELVSETIAQSQLANAFHLATAIRV